MFSACTPPAALASSTRSSLHAARIWVAETSSCVSGSKCKRTPGNSSNPCAIPLAQFRRTQSPSDAAPFGNDPTTSSSEYPGRAATMKSHSPSNSSALCQVADIAEGVDPNQKVQAVALAQPSLHSPYRINRVTRSALHMRLRIGCFEQGWQKVRLSRQRQRHHRVAMKVRGDRRLLLVRRNICRNEPDFFQLESLSGCAGHIQVSAMDGIERAAEQCDIHSDRSNSFSDSATA